jgi:hypothetical protein
MRQVANDSTMSKQEDEIDFMQYISNPNSRLDLIKDRLNIVEKGVR